MKQSLFFPLVVETDQLSTELFVYNPFTREAKEVAANLTGGEEPVLRYRVEITDGRGTQAAALDGPPLPPLGIHRYLLRDLVSTPFSGSARIDCSLADGVFHANATRYLQTRANIYADTSCIITDHGRQQAGADEEVIYGEFTVDHEADTAIFLTHTGSRDVPAHPVMHVRDLKGIAHISPMPSLEMGKSLMTFVSDTLPEYTGDGMITVKEPQRGLLTGYHFKVPRRLRGAFIRAMESSH